MINWFEVEFILLKHLRLQPSELDAMEFYRAEYLLHFFREYAEKEKEQQEKESSRYNTNDMMKNSGFNKDSLKQMTKGNMPNMGSLGNNLPKKFPSM